MGLQEGEVPLLRRPGDSLPDLTDRLVELGIYQQYVSWRDGYHRWRQGQAKGAKGEATVNDLTESADKEGFRYWYPDEVSIQFRETVAYWIAVTFLEGSLLFAVSGLFGAAGKDVWPSLSEVLTARPSFAGAILYTVGTYLLYFEVINIGIKSNEKVNYVWCNWKQLREEYDVGWSSITGGVAYFVGALFYQVSCTAGFVGMWAPLPESLQKPILQLPLFVGGVLFVVGGISELCHNQVLTSKPDTLVWWVSVFNFSGAVCFCISGIPAVSEEAMNWFTFVGAIFFSAAAVLSLGMWKVGQFGLALLGQLNKVARLKGVPIVQRMGDGAIVVPEAVTDSFEPSRMSVRGIGFILCYTTCGAVCVVNCCFGGMHPSHEMRDVNIVLQELMNAIIIHCVLVLKSAGLHKMPKEQPYRLLVLAMRILVVVMLVNSVFTTVIFLKEADS
mmetsp:Transcript_75606/g.196735  ORF Transcript_75606/g.196735 Transcript_75606/m.196735 type:complete len:445 (+) Transcript_75606:67-1401(+)